MTWTSPELPPTTSIGPLGWLLVVIRGTAVCCVVGLGLLMIMALRLFERPFFGLHRPISPYVTVAVGRVSLAVMGLRLKSTGKFMRQRGGVVANHASWLDVFVLNAVAPLYFVSKSEVAGWPAIGFAARVAGTVFIRRNGRDAKVQKHLFEERLRAGHRLMFFPEGTSSDSRRVLPFKSTLFAAFFEPELRKILYVQPVSITYYAPKGRDSRFYGWWGNMEFGAHFMAVLAAPRQGWVDVMFHPEIAVADCADRKVMAARCEASVRAGVVLPDEPAVLAS
jgi:1-acyl-sn-glycerol-3-phosphate acyltransferase